MLFHLVYCNTVQYSRAIWYFLDNLKNNSPFCCQNMSQEVIDSKT